MTDADRWRQQARCIEQREPMQCGFCLCDFVGSVKRDDHDAGRRMAMALDLFEPDVPEDGSIWWRYITPSSSWLDRPLPIDRDGMNERLLAACFLAAMADADGGNHAEASP